MKNFCCKKKPFIFLLYKGVLIGLTIIIIGHYLYQNSSLYYRKTLTLPFSLHLNEQDLYMVKGEEFRLSVFGFKKWVSYTSTNFRVAGVNFNGRVFAYQTGKAFILAKVKEKELKCRVHVIDMNKSHVRLQIHDTYHLKVIGAHSFTRWKSSDVSVATVTIFGKVKAQGRGSATIYAKIKGKVLKCNVQVR